MNINPALFRTLIVHQRVVEYRFSWQIFISSSV
nr:MAG TPA: Protein of unknown function (DUF2627) [Caudoviricetes sp.]